MPKIAMIDPSYKAPFVGRGTIIGPLDLLRNGEYWTPEDYVVFPGGPDVPPEMYGEKYHPNTRTDHERYKLFDEVFDKARNIGMKMVGICGGAQYLCVKAGGSLIQDVTNHAIHGTHAIKTDDGREIQVTSTHHQMQYPWTGKFGNPRVGDIIAWAEELSQHYDYKKPYQFTPEGKYVEPDVVWYSSINALGVQYHPEYLHESHEGYKYFQELLDRFGFN